MERKWKGNTSKGKKIGGGKENGEEVKERIKREERRGK